MRSVRKPEAKQQGHAYIIKFTALWEKWHKKQAGKIILLGGGKPDSINYQKSNTDGLL